MRRFALAFLIATTAATPALSQFAPEGRRAAREQARNEAADGGEARTERRQRALVAGEAPRPARPAIDRAVERGRASASAGGADPRIEQPSRDSVANWRSEQREQMRQSGGGSSAERVRRPRLTPPVDARPDRPAPAPRAAAHRTGAPRWASSWHNDRRFNWRDHRRRYGSLFRPGFYFDPFGWSYRRYDRGWRLWPSYYGSSYWLSDPFRYRLPHAPYPYKWIRYWDDALLVDTLSGEVVDVAHDFFW